MSEIKIFEHPMFGGLPVVVINGKEYLGANEVASALEYARPHKAVADHCDEDGVLTWDVIDRLGRNQQKKFITLGNVSRLIVAASKQSKNPEIQQKAKVYEKWIFDEVIPSVHKHGAYVHATEEDDEVTILAKGMLAAKKALERKDKLIAEQKQIIETQRPKVVYADAVEVSTEAILVKQLAAILTQKGVKIGETRLFVWLRENGYLCKQKGAKWNMPTQRSLELGVIVVKQELRTGSNGEMKPTYTPKITGKGQIYFVNKILAEHGLLAI